MKNKQKEKHAVKKIFIETVPLILGVAAAYFFWENNVLLTVLFLLTITLILKTNYKQGDFFALFYGFIIGIIIEIIGTSVSGYQSFANPDFLGIPIWLPIAWAFGFMLMKRIGIIIYQSR